MGCELIAIDRQRTRGGDDYFGPKYVSKAKGRFTSRSRECRSAGRLAMAFMKYERLCRGIEFHASSSMSTQKDG